jgi:Flp pilus assembly protein CpaB
MALKHLIPLFVLVVVVGILTFVGLAVYSIVQEVSTKAREKIEKKNISITKGGLKVGVKELRDEEYRDRSQKYVSIFPPIFEVKNQG